MTTKRLPVPSMPEMTLEDVHKTVRDLVLIAQTNQGWLGGDAGGSTRTITVQDLRDLGLIDAATYSNLSRRKPPIAV